MADEHAADDDAEKDFSKIHVFNVTPLLARHARRYSPLQRASAGDQRVSPPAYVASRWAKAATASFNASGRSIVNGRSSEARMLGTQSSFARPGGSQRRIHCSLARTTTDTSCAHGVLASASRTYSVASKPGDRVKRSASRRGSVIRSRRNVRIESLCG